MNFRHDLEDRITEEILEPGNLGVITGGATGTEYSYIDLFVYNQQVFISTLLPLLAEYSFYLSEFCRQGQLCDFQTANHGKEKVLMAFRTVREMIHSSVR